jgi:hypothetical protein
MVECFVVVDAAASSDDVHAWLAAIGGRQLQTYGERALVVELPEDAADSAPTTAPGIVRVFAGPVPDDVGDLDDTARLGVAAWNTRRSATFRRSREERRGEGRSWGDEEAEPEG